jgi:HEAT repeat protein
MRFDLISFILGFVTAAILVGVIFRFRVQLIALRDRFVAWFKKVRESLTSGTDNRYREDVLALWQKNHLAGTILSYDDIFVQPRFWIDVPPATPNKEEELDLTAAIPATPDYPELAAFYKSPSYSVRDLTRTSHDLVIIGKPGMGKSMMLIQIGLRAAAMDKECFPDPLVPAFVHAGDLELPITERMDVAQPLLNAAADRLSAITAPTFPGFFKTIIKNGNGLILLDGIDDLPPQHQALTFEWLKNFKAAYPGNRIIATGASTGYLQFINLGFTPVVLGGLSNDEYLELVNRWVSAWTKVLAAQKRKRKAEDDSDPALVAGWLMGGTIGRTPLDVTAKIWTGLAGDAEGSRANDWLETFTRRLSFAPEAHKALERAAVEMLTRDRYGVPRDQLRGLINLARGTVSQPSAMDPEDLIDEMASPGGLLVKRSGGRYSFAHPVVGGYLAAKALVADTLPIDTLLTIQHNPTYAPALRFYAALGNATPIVTQRLATPPDAIQSDLFFVANWLGDAPATAPWRADVFRKLAQVYITPTHPLDLRMRAVCVLVMTRDENVNKLFKQSLGNPDAFTRQCSVAALGALGDITAVPEIAKLLFDPDLYVTWSAALALALIGDQESIEALGKAILEGNELLKQATCEALALHPSEGHEMLKEAMNINDIVARRSAVLGLKRIGAKDWVLTLLDQAYVGDTQWIVRNAAEEAIQELRNPTVRSPQSLPPIEQTTWLIDYASSNGQGVPAGPAARNVLMQALQEGEDMVRVAAADHLGRIAATEAIAPLTEAARGSQPALKEMAYRALANIALATGQRVTI